MYSKKPEDFVKRLKDNANAKEVVEEDAEELLAKNQQEEKAEFFEDKKISFANEKEQLVDNSPSDLINLQNNPPEQKPPQQVNLLEAETAPPAQPSRPPPPNNSLLDLGESDQSTREQSTRSYQTSVSPSVNKGENAYATTVMDNSSNQGSSIFDFIGGAKNIKNIVIPFVEVIS